MEHDTHALREVTQLAMARVRELLGEIRGEQPPDEFYSSARKSRGDDGAA
jgi:1-acyl-sn-glycerol-3-phosphate acyltransferase